MIKILLNYLLHFNLINKQNRIEAFNEIKSIIIYRTIYLLLLSVSLIVNKNKKYNKTICDFNGRYIIESKDKSFVFSIIFRNNKMNIYKVHIEKPDIIIYFKNIEALRKLIFSSKPDILQASLNQDVIAEGNFNYLYKLASILNNIQQI